MDMQFTPDDVGRLMIYEQTRIVAEANYAKNPNDADVSLSSSLSHLVSFSVIFFLSCFWFFWKF